MIPDIFYFIVGTIFQMVAYILSPIQFAITSSFTTSLLYLFNYLNYFNGVIHVSIVGACIVSLLTFDSLWYGYKLFLFLIHLTPVLGNPQHPDAK